MHRLTGATCAISVDARDANSVVDLSGLTGRWSSLGYYQLHLEAQTGASILIPNVTQFEYAFLRIDDTGIVPTAQLNLLTNVDLWVDNASPNLGRVTNIDNTSVTALNGGIARLTNVINFDVGGQDVTWKADGTGSLIDLSTLSRAAISYYQRLYVQALDGGVVDLGGLQSLSTGSVQILADGSTSQVDLTSLSSFISDGYYDSSLKSQNGG